MPIKTPAGTKPDGSPRWHYGWTDDERARISAPADDPSKLAIFLTGPIAGTITLADGTAYDVSEDTILVAERHLPELQLAIHRAHHAAGRFLDAPLPA